MKNRKQPQLEFKREKKKFQSRLSEVDGLDKDYYEKTKF